jgi:hypothetical protein
VTKQSDHFIDATDTFQQTHNLISLVSRLLRSARNDKMIKHKTPCGAFCACARNHLFRWLSLLGFLEGIIPGIGARPAAAWLLERVTGQAARTAMRQDTRRLFWQKGRWVDDLSFQGNFLTCMVTIGDF